MEGKWTKWSWTKRSILSFILVLLLCCLLYYTYCTPHFTETPKGRKVKKSRMRLAKLDKQLLHMACDEKVGLEDEEELVTDLTEEEQQLEDQDYDDNEIRITGTLSKRVRFNSSLPFSTWMRRPRLLQRYRNPCWSEAVDVEDPYKQSLFTPRFKTQLQETFRRRLQRGRNYRIRCLPFFYILGMPKCGTTDLYYKLVVHPDVVGGTRKEPHWWTRARFTAAGAQMTRYLDNFDSAAECIRRKLIRTRQEPFLLHHLITGEASASTLWDNSHWRSFPGNQNLTALGKDEPRELTAHHIRHLQPAARLIVILRNPSDRAFSDYLYHYAKRTPKDFHQRVTAAVATLKECFSQQNLRSCAYNITKKTRLVTLGLYSTFLKDWFSVFPRRQIFVVRLEEYSKKRSMVLNKLYRFLGLPPLPVVFAEALDNLAASNSRKTHQLKMLNETRQLLDEFYLPHKEELARMLDHPGYLWSGWD